MRMPNGTTPVVFQPATLHDRLAAELSEARASFAYPTLYEAWGTLEGRCGAGSARWASLSLQLAAHAPKSRGEGIRDGLVNVSAGTARPEQFRWLRS